jgi:HlyD family secretion protein
VTAVQVADFGGWLVETTDLSELDVVALAVGFPAEIRLDALPGETLTGKVIKISPTATVEAGDVRYQVTIQLDDPGDLPLRWGMTALVDIEVDQ